uniref:SCP domain-containing protein n=2 Tax=Strongyloides papillosus TaxID=174720 RepID=A0A0N5CDN8_STREA
MIKKLSLKRSKHSSHRKVTVRRPSYNYGNCIMNIKLYLGERKIYKSIYYTIWRDFDYKHYWINSYADYKLRIIHHINLIRLIHGVCPLQEDEYLDALAQTYANELTKRGIFFRDSNNYSKKYGIIEGASLFSQLTAIVSRMYDEKNHYNFYLNFGTPMTSHFTQLVWKSTRSIGIGVLKKNDIFTIVLFFYPKGNIRGEYKKNVFKKQISWKKTMI